MKKTSTIIILILVLLALRIFIGAQINFDERDFNEIYLIGLIDAFSGNWSYWGPDVVWSHTRLPGALQGILAGLPLRLTEHYLSPLILANIISLGGLVLLAFYAKNKFSNLSIYFLIILLGIWPFGLFNGSVLLNTAYLIFTGALLFISTFELFIYREKMIFKPKIYFLIIGFSLAFTYQLHLTWVMFLPFIVVLFYLEWQRKEQSLALLFTFFLIGCLIPSSLLMPTLIKYGNYIYVGTEDNLSIDFTKLGSVFDLFFRYLGMATSDINISRRFIQDFTNSGPIGFILAWALRIFAVIQFIAFCYSFYYIKKTIEFKKVWLLFALTLIMALSLFTLSDKHLTTRTYILLHPIPIWLSFYSYSFFTQYKYSKKIFIGSLGLLFAGALYTGITNYQGKQSFHFYKEKINAAIDQKNPKEFGQRRYTKMDKYN